MTTDSTLGNVSFLDNSELAKQTAPFMTMQNEYKRLHYEQTPCWFRGAKNLIFSDKK